jgi:hypothetical protein
MHSGTDGLSVAVAGDASAISSGIALMATTADRVMLRGERDT